MNVDSPTFFHDAPCFLNKRCTLMCSMSKLDPYICKINWSNLENIFYDKTKTLILDTALNTSYQQKDLINLFSESNLL